MEGKNELPRQSERRIMIKQKDVVKYMKDGWELCVSSGFSGYHSWLQKDGCGKGGEVKDITVGTFLALNRKGVIEVKKYGYPTSVYKLKELEEEYE